MAKFIIYTIIVFCFGLFAKLENESISMTEIETDLAVEPVPVFQKSEELAPTTTDSEAYKNYLKVLDQTGPKEENIAQHQAIESSKNREVIISDILIEKKASAQNSITEQETKEVVTGNLAVNKDLDRSELVVDHTTFGFLLQKYVDNKGDVNYAAFKEDEKKLDTYLNTLSKNPPISTWSKNERLAYYVNAYNAYTIKLILDNYPVSSIMDINNGKPWDKAFIKLGTNSYSLNNIENDIIRKEFNEPRIHFAVNCAAASCPPLMNDAFYPDNLDTQLERQTVAFINNSAYNSISSSKVKLSKIFDWYGSDFNGVKDYLKKYTKIDVSNSEVVFNEYDWSLNAQ